MYAVAKAGKSDIESMDVDRSGRGLAIRVRAARMRRFLGAPTWYLRMRLTWTRSAINRMEQQLGGEFALTEISPLHDELDRLMAERDRLNKLLERD